MLQKIFPTRAHVYRWPLKPFRVLAAGLGLVLVATASLAQGAKKDDGFQTSAPHAILIEGDSGSVLFEKNADQLMYPSSMAKLMTAEVILKAIKDGQLKPDDEVTISENA